MGGSYFLCNSELCTNEEFKNLYDNDHHARAHYLQNSNNTQVKKTTACPATPDSQGYQRT